ncbi:MAG: hypothetical protein GY916_10470 [Gammaproteobacteria bacterium]|nr:hypothetical protein [Gammaproteobacteria bacterium]
MSSPIGGSGGAVNGAGTSNNTTAVPNNLGECYAGSYIEALDQVLGEDIDLVGTDQSIHYRSDRTLGYSRDRTLTIPITSDDVPAPLQGVKLDILVAGKRFRQSFDNTPGQSFEFIWDGLNVYGQQQASATAEIKISYVYPAVYTEPTGVPRSFGIASESGVELVGSRSGSTFDVSRTYYFALASRPNQSDALGGWTLTNHHAYDPFSRILHLGSGQQLSSSGLFDVIETVAGNYTYGFTGDGGPALEAAMFPRDIEFDAAGNLYILDGIGSTLRKVDANGIITRVAGQTGANTFSGDGGPAIDATLERPEAIAVAPDGVIYITENFGSFVSEGRVRKIDRNGIITTVTGNGQEIVNNTPGLPAEEYRHDRFYSLAVGDDGSLYIGSGLGILKYDAQGLLEIIAGHGTVNVAEGLQARTAKFSGTSGSNFRSLVIDKSDTIYFTTDIGGRSRVYKFGADGEIHEVGGFGNLELDGVDARDVHLDDIVGLAVAEDQSIIIAEQSGSGSQWEGQKIRRISADGIITTLAGTGELGSFGENGPAARAQFKNPRGIALSPNGDVFLADLSNYAVRKISSAFLDPGVGSILIPSQDAARLYRFNANGRHVDTVNSITGAVTRAFAYDPQGRLVSITDIDGDRVNITRDSNGVATSIVAPDGQVTGVVIDASDHLVEVINPDGKSTKMTYLLDGLLERFENYRQHATTYQFDAMGLLEQSTDPLGGGWTLFRNDIDASNYTVSVTSADGRATLHDVSRLANGNRQLVETRPDGAATTTAFLNDGSLNTTLPDGTVVARQDGPDPRFDMRAPVAESVTVTTPGGLSSVSTLSRTAALSDEDDVLSLTAFTETRTVNGRSFERGYEPGTQTWTETTPENRSSTLQISIKGQPVLSQVTGLNATAISYDDRGRVKTITEGSGAEARLTTLAYYETGLMQGYLESILDAENRTTRFEYDVLDRVTKQIMPDNREILYGYDENGNLASLTPPGRPAHIFKYDELDQEEEYTPPAVVGIATPQTIYRYNLDKQLVEITRPDLQQITMDYGITTGLLDSMTIPGGTYGYNYDPGSAQLTGITAPSGSTLGYSYDGSLLTNTSLAGDVSGSVASTYDNDFRISSRSVNGTSSVVFDYDHDSLMTQAGVLTIAREVQKAGLISGSTLGALTTTRNYNGFAEMDAFDASYNANSLFSAGYVRDKLGRIRQKTDIVEGVTTVTLYDYDLAGRLETETTGGVTTTYAYDANGNRTHIDGVLVGTYDDQDRLSAYQSASYAYTDNGELLSKTESGTTTDYQYDVLGNLRQATLPGGMIIDYVIDGQNRRVGKKIDGVLTQGFLYKDQLNPIAELDGNNNITVRFIYGTKVNVPDYMVKGGNTYRIISDLLGSPRLVVNVADGLVAQRMDYDTWGNVTQDTNPGFQPFGFAGGLYDQHIRLTRFGARDYDPQTARWTSKDPIRFAGGDANVFGYVLADPINSLDPSGLLTLFGSGGVEIPFVGGADIGIMITTSPIDIGVYGELSKAVGGLAKGKLTLGAGFELGGREKFDGMGSKLSIGLDAVGIDLSYGGEPDSTMPTGGAINIGPQLGIEGFATATGSITVRDLAGFLSDFFTGTPDCEN